jgi:hypothetical protein
MHSFDNFCQIMSYNPGALVFGYFAATFEWMDSGIIRLTFNILVRNLTCDFLLSFFYLTYILLEPME